MNEVSFSRIVKEVKFGAWLLDPKRQTISDGAQERELEPLLFKLLCYLLINNERIVTRQELIDDVWCQKYVDDNAINRAMSELRRVLKSGKQRDLIIKTHYRKGYSFVLNREIVYFDSAAHEIAIPEQECIVEKKQSQFKLTWIYFIGCVLITLIIVNSLLFGKSAQLLEADTATVNYREQILSWLEGNYFLPRMHPNQKLFAISYRPKDSLEDVIVIRDLASGKESKVAIAGKNLEPLGWSSDSNSFYFMAMKLDDNKECELWEMDYLNPQRAHQKVMNCDPNQLMVAGLRNKLIYESYGYRGNPELSVLVARDLDTGKEFQITSPNLNSKGDKLLYFDSKSEKLYFERVQHNQSEIFVTDIEGMDAQKIAIQTPRVWIANLVDGEVLAWFERTEAKFHRFDVIKKQSLVDIEINSNEDFYNAVLMSDLKAIAFTEPREWDIYAVDMASSQQFEFATTDAAEQSFTIIEQTKAYLAGIKNNRAIVIAKGQERRSLDVDVSEVEKIHFSETEKRILLVGEHFIKIIDLESEQLENELYFETSIVESFRINNDRLGLVLHAGGRNPSSAMIYEFKSKNLIKMPFSNLIWFGFLGEDKYVTFNSENELAITNLDGGEEQRILLEDVNNRAYKHLFAIRNESLIYSNGYDIYQYELSDISLTAKLILKLQDKIVTGLHWSESEQKLYIESTQNRANLMLLAVPEISSLK